MHYLIMPIRSDAFVDYAGANELLIDYSVIEGCANMKWAIVNINAISWLQQRCLVNSDASRLINSPPLGRDGTVYILPTRLGIVSTMK